MSSEGRRLLVGTGWTLVSTVVALALGAVLNPVLVLYLGVGGYGEWAAAIAVASLFGLAGDLGVAGALTKFTAERQGRHEDVGSMGGTALVVGLVAGSIAGLALAVLSPAIGNASAYAEFATLLQIQAAQMPMNLGVASILGLCQGRRLFRAIAGLSVLQVSGSFALTIVFLAAGGGVVGVMSASLIASVAVFLSAVALFRRDLRFGGFQALRSDFRKLVPFGFQLTLTNAFSAALYQTDLVVLTFLVRDPQLLGLYALATFVTRALWIFPGSIGTTTYPVISEYAAANRGGRVGRYMSTALVASVAITGLLSAAIILFGRPALAIVFSRSAVPSFDLAVLMLFGTAFLGAVRSVASSIPGFGRPDVGLRISIFGAGLLLVLSLPLVALWSGAGAASAVTISFSAVAILLLWSIRRYVLRPQGVDLDFRRTARTGLLAVLFAGLSGAFSLPSDPSGEGLVVAVLVMSVAAFVLVESSGGRQAWAMLMKRPTASTAERS